MSRKRGGEDEGNVNGEGTLEVPLAESLTISTVVSTAPATTDQALTVSTAPVSVEDFMATDDFRRLFQKYVSIVELYHTYRLSTDDFMQTPEFYRHFLDYVPVCTLMSMKLVNKELRIITEQFVLAGKRLGGLIVHDGRDEHDGRVGGVGGVTLEAIKEMYKNVTEVTFPLNITKVGQYACTFAVNLVVVDISEGVESIGYRAFGYCSSLTTVSFPATIISICLAAFSGCRSLKNVDLFHTNLQELDDKAFYCCSELKSITIPDSLQTLGDKIFY
ncbi:hypothetical protein TL16_g07909 [Triparma laevis f. inornata]|uniref:Uncharacterized protein n=1 Tax=Triparma laevis f. inornata TaxID=1714386 RepID=A0A9W7EHA2_9STRA|nr:hypothetical protein TL16_g07909 [Triparma laevis f. inornata]